MKSGRNSAGRGSGDIGERGIALVLVLWVMALLAVMVVGFASDARVELQLARNQAEAAQARSLADTGVSLAILKLLDQNTDAPWHLDGETHLLAYGDGHVRVSVQDEAGKIDLNVAPDQFVANLLRTVGLDPNESARLAAAIATWKRQRSAANNGVADGRMRGGFSMGPFVALEELRGVPGMTPEAYALISPFLTIYARRDRVDPLTAPVTVLRSLPGANLAEIDAFVAARDRTGPIPGALPPLLSVADSVAHTALQAATITSEGSTAAGTHFIRQAVVTITNQPNAPYSVVAWRELRDAAPSQAAQQRAGG